MFRTFLFLEIRILSQVLRVKLKKKLSFKSKTEKKIVHDYKLINLPCFHMCQIIGSITLVRAVVINKGDIKFFLSLRWFLL